MKKQPEPMRGRGRPATGQMPKRYFRMGDDEWARIESAAGAAGVSVSEWIRERLLKAAKRESRSS